MTVRDRVRFESIPVLLLGLALAALAPPAGADERPARDASRRAARHARSLGFGELAPIFDAVSLVSEGRRTFRSDTFGDEAFWGDTLRLHEAIAQTSPADALALGLKVDAEALPHRLAFDLRRGRVDLEAERERVRGGRLRDRLVEPERVARER
ncbi:MAG TPA: hypothetical protein VNE71_18785, partial [Myxococcota bacterium]|nr:hypothetical protein [Myxococcota bacterium]